MLKSAVIAHFKTQAAVARALEISEAAVSLWDEVIPEGSAYKIESVTRRALRVDPALYSKTGLHARRTDQAAAS